MRGVVGWGLLVDEYLSLSLRQLSRLLEAHSLVDGHGDDTLLASVVSNVHTPGVGSAVRTTLYLHGIRSPPPPPDVPRGDVTVVGGHSTALHAHAAWRKRGQRGPSAPREGDEMLEVSVDGKLHWEARVEEEAKRVYSGSVGS